MHTQTFNIGLRTNLHPQTDLHPADVIEYVSKRLASVARDTLRNVRWRVDTAQYQRDDGSPVTEDTLVLQLTMADSVSPIPVQEVYLWSERLHQDCIAVEYVSDSIGSDPYGFLVGPNASQYGAFDPQYFIRY